MAAGITLAFYVAWVVSYFSKDWGWVANLSIFTAYEPQRALESGRIERSHLGVFLALWPVCTLLALVFLWRRDAIS